MARKTTTARGGGHTTRAASPGAKAKRKNTAPALSGEDSADIDAETPDNDEDEEAEGGARYVKPPTNWRQRFLARLSETSNVTAAAAQARVALAIVYKARRTDAAFRAAWFAALAEGYDNLEMELLQHLRGVETAEVDGAEGTKKRPFDTATAFRCLAAHRDNVAREKGRRSLDHEVATIASINEKIDRLRLNAKAADKAITAARRSNRARTAAQPDEGRDDG